ncbi:MAG: hypothetical protein PHY82_11995, partial [Lentisphaeria bacterium]|nr:hypothetical protein [Lentisphaeria bacterium]
SAVSHDGHHVKLDKGTATVAAVNDSCVISTPSSTVKLSKNDVSALYVRSSDTHVISMAGRPEVDCHGKNFTIKPGKMLTLQGHGRMAAPSGFSGGF